MTGAQGDSLTIEIPPPGAADGPLVAHVCIVAFHARLGNRIEFAYPRLRGDVELRSLDLNDSLDISADPLSPSQSPRPYSTGLTPRPQPIDTAALGGTTIQTPSPSAGGKRGDWGQLPDEWRFLPFMALPEGVHDLHHDVVFFTLEPNVHCVSCFRQVNAAGNASNSASGGRGFESGVAARGSVQKSVVLLCRRPLYGVLADRLAPAVRAYFEQADFARTDVLASLFHSLNSSLSRPSLRNAPTLFHGLDLRSLVRLVGMHALSILKLIMLEKRVVFYSQPVAIASNAVVAFASIFPGALDTVAPTMEPLDTDTEDSKINMKDHGYPLALFSARDRVVLQPYAPLPHIAELLQTPPAGGPLGCLIATSHNVGVLLSSAAAASSRERAASPATRLPVKGTVKSSPMRSQSVSSLSRSTNSTPVLQAKNRNALPKIPQSEPRRSVPHIDAPSNLTSSESRSQPSSPKRKRKQPGGKLPVVDALVNLSTGKVSVSGSLEPTVRITKAERRFMRDLVAAAAAPSSASVSSSGATGSFIGSDDYVRARLRTYLNGFLASAATVNGMAGGPPLTRGLDSRWHPSEIQRWDLSNLAPYSERFAKEWLTTRNAAIWTRRFNTDIAVAKPPPTPQVLPDSALEEGVAALPAALQMPVDDLVTGLRQNVAEISRLSNIFSERAAQGFSSFFKRMEHEVSRVETAIGAAGGGYSPVNANSSSAESQNVGTTTRNENGKDAIPILDSIEALRLSKSDTTTAAKVTVVPSVRKPSQNAASKKEEQSDK